ncbi:MAG: ATP-binding protein [Bacteroidota bacterium]
MESIRHNSAYAFFIQVAEHMKNASVIADETGKIVWVNKSFEAMTGYPMNEVIGKKPKDFLQGPDSSLDTLEQMSTALNKKEYVQVDIINYRKNGEAFLVELQIPPVKDEQGRYVGFIAIQKDISYAEKSEEELLYNLRQQELLSEIALDLNKYIEFERSIQLVLEALLHHTQVSRIYIFENVDNGLACSNTFEVCNTEIEPQINNLKYVPYEVVPYWEVTLREKGIIFSENISEFPADVREILEPQEIKSILVYPIYVNGENFGFIGFDECVKYKHWKKSDLELLRAVSGIIGNAYERELARKSLVLKNEELRKINSELDSFVYSISHDLRSPLLSIKGILNLVFKKSVLDEKASGLLHTAESAVNRLDETIQEILDYSRNSRLSLSNEAVDLNKMVTDICTDLKYAAPQNFIFKYDLSEETFHIKTDQSRLNTVLKNIIGNAVKYLRRDIDNPHVVIESKIEDDCLVMNIKDNGEGIATDSLSKVFDMFYRASKSSTGSGLGLYICKEIIQKMKGRIHLDSVLQNGTTVIIHIPVSNN